jgi:phosphatidylserine/phosphatidylglycerophosphate/cardiolipin synthase-like enzyme
MFRLKALSYRDNIDLVRSKLHNEQSFYSTFITDINRAQSLVVIESPFITCKRLLSLYPTLEKATQRGVRIVINTRDPQTHDVFMMNQALDAIAWLQELDITVLYTGNIHRKVAIIDGHILWEGSLNILSQSDSSEMMRRSESANLVSEMIRFIGLAKWYT